jgi:REP element-mobilizing transposase RayT
MQALEALEHSKYYHIYNRGINSCDLFTEEDNYAYFLSLYEKYIDPIADTFAWVLMPNHFHFLIRLKDIDEIDLTGFKNLSGRKPPHQYFSNLFNAYTKAFNKRNNRHGALFERPFKRKLVEDESYLKQLVLYIHNNPVHHGFCCHPLDYGWSSYLTCLSLKPTKLQRNETLGLFDNEANFKYSHENTIESKEIEAWLEI